MDISWLINKKDSILFQITLFFSFLFIIINALIVYQFVLDRISYDIAQVKRFKQAVDMLIEENHLEGDFDINKMNKKLSHLSLEYTLMDIRYLRQIASKSVISKKALKDTYYVNNQEYVHLKSPFPKGLRPPKGRPKGGFRPPPPEHKDIFLPPPRSNQMVGPKAFNLITHIRGEGIIFINHSTEEKFRLFWLMILFCTDVLLIAFYLFIRKKMKPLSLLESEIKKFSDGDLNINTHIDGKDEIAKVGNEFNQAIKQLRELRNSRNLFLRNIMHELKTPIAKGRLVCDLYEESERKDILVRVFRRLEYLLGEFSKVEQLTSKKFELQKREYRAVDLVDQAMDIMLLDNDKIDIDRSPLLLRVDFDFFCIAIKNLLDNAMRYNTNGNPEILMTKKSIIIRNEGLPLPKNIEHYYSAFNHEYEDSSEGLGLGLYITKNIITIHGYELNYRYENGYHHFIIAVD